MESSRTRDRWNPAEFIPCVKRWVLSTEIGAWVLSSSVCAMALWHAGTDVTVAVNRFGLQICAAGIVEVTQRTLERTNSPVRGSVFVILTDVSLMNDVNYFGNPRRNPGPRVRLSIDESGRDSRSLGRLKRFPIDELKVDQGFVKGPHRPFGYGTSLRRLSHGARPQTFGDRRGN